MLPLKRRDWQGLFEPHHVVENVIRASAVYLLLFFLLRVLPNRKTGSLGPAGLLVLVLLATVVNGALNRDVSSLTDAVVMVATIVTWGFVIDILADRVPVPAPSAALRSGGGRARR